MNLTTNLPTMENIRDVFYSDIESVSSYSFKCKNSSDSLKKYISNCSHSSARLNANFKDDLDNLTNHNTVDSVPGQYGLENSERIIPMYYLTGHRLEGKIFVLDYLFTIKDDIMNLRPLNERQIKYIAQSNIDIDKTELVVMMNESMKTLCTVFLSEE
jgi:hypothetical protein